MTLYGINGIGKTTQVEFLVKFLQAQGKQASRLKYPVYDLEPEGPFLYKYLRDPDFRAKNSRTTDELQKIFSENRLRYEKTLLERLRSGEWLVSEDYVGTGIAWGLTWAADLEYLEKINEKLYKSDLNILMHGKRYMTAVEPKHRNENEEERINICKNFFLLLAERYDWKRVAANQSVEAVSQDIINIVQEIFSQELNQ